ncbi:uncharacterized protein LOC130675833 [Microplitis mediator]|uniref:uncharacterized protein LOC130675833 n=1 Tax=Microplitis mediator TaxID=375433 RepID=UPI00255413F1|nr:uncharacterized protein LOC130675833 [Microplitis mediator]
MASSIEKLASYLDDGDKKITKKYYSDSQQFQLAIRKGVFPYEYIDSIDKLDDTKLPEKKLFYSKLNDCDISDEDYNHAKQVWNKFNINTLGEYSDLYLKTDLAFDAMLKLTDVKLDLLDDPEMILFFEKGIRGGVSQCTNRYAKANNRFMGEDFDQSKDESYLMYYDVNNLYGAAMSMPLPQGSFEWIHEDIDVQNVDKFFNDNKSIGYILEVDLEYPIELHDEHRDLSLCHEHFIPPGRMKLVKVHRVLKFKQSAWLKQYIDENTECRKNAQNEFEKNFYKLTNNAVFGKTMENVRKYSDVRMVNNILDLSKTFVYDFHYNYIKKNFNVNESKLLYADTDSLIYYFNVPNIYDTIKRDIEKLDTPDYPPNNVYNNPLKNKKVLGLMEDECSGQIMTKFVGLRAKLYAFKIHKNNIAKKRAKGAKGSTLRKIMFDDFKNCLVDHLLE